LDIAGNVLEGARRLEDFAGLHEEAGALDFFGGDEDGIGHGDLLAGAIRQGHQDFDAGVEAGANLKAGLAQRGFPGGLYFERIDAGPDFGEAKVAGGVGGGAFGQFDEADPHAGQGLGGTGRGSTRCGRGDGAGDVSV